MAKFNYSAPAELYPTRRFVKSQMNQYRRFTTAAEAIRFIVEELPASWLAGAHLEVDEQRFEGGEIRALYEAAAYPFDRALVLGSPSIQAPSGHHG